MAGSVDSGRTGVGGYRHRLYGGEWRRSGRGPRSQRPTNRAMIASIGTSLLTFLSRSLEFMPLAPQAAAARSVAGRARRTTTHAELSTEAERRGRRGGGWGVRWWELAGARQVLPGPWTIGSSLLCVIAQHEARRNNRPGKKPYGGAWAHSDYFRYRHSRVRDHCFPFASDHT